MTGEFALGFLEVVARIKTNVIMAVDRCSKPSFLHEVYSLNA